MRTASDAPGAAQRALIEAAASGDQSAYERLVEPHRGELHAHCYRMLGSVHDAEDALQEALVRAWRGLGRFEGRSSLRSWLYRIATNTCLDAVARRPTRVLPIDYGPASDPHDGPATPVIERIWVEPYPDDAVGLADGRASPEARYEQREAVELAFITALQLLPARQRAVLILREVLGFSAAEVAEQLEATVASVNSALQRARKTISDRLPDRSQQQIARELGDAELRAAVERYMAAWERGDVATVVGMLTEDAVLAMPPMPTWFRGRDAIEVFLHEWAFAKPWSPERVRFEAGERAVRLVPASANGQPAIAAYARDPDTGRARPYALQVLRFDGARIAEIVGFVTPEAFPEFDLPAELPA
jgi:RNA polymerase sigma-70 factor, ECF subfamily